MLPAVTPSSWETSATDRPSTCVAQNAFTTCRGILLEPVRPPTGSAPGRSAELAGCRSNRRAFRPAVSGSRSALAGDLLPFRIMNLMTTLRATRPSQRRNEASFPSFCHPRRTWQWRSAGAASHRLCAGRGFPASAPVASETVRTHRQTQSRPARSAVLKSDDQTLTRLRRPHDALRVGVEGWLIMESPAGSAISRGKTERIRNRYFRSAPAGVFTARSSIMSRVA